MRKPHIFVFVSDLFFITRIESVADRLGYAVKLIESLEQVAIPDPNTPLIQLGEHIIGPGARLVELLTELQPALLIFDISNDAIPWREWIALIKSVPATRRLPVICFGSHMDKEAINAARNAGADKVLVRSRFVGDIPGTIEKYSRSPDYEAIEYACSHNLSLLGIEGIELFNRGEYFEAHELLEDAWNEEESPGREFYRAILQTAVAYLHIERGNYNGAKKMFLRLRQWIDPLPEYCRGVDIGKLRVDIDLVYDTLLSLGKDRISEFDSQLFRPIEYREINDFLEDCTEA